MRMIAMTLAAASLLCSMAIPGFSIDGDGEGEGGSPNPDDNAAVPAGESLTETDPAVGSSPSEDESQVDSGNDDGDNESADEEEPTEE